MTSAEIQLPWPPSNDQYYRAVPTVFGVPLFKKTGWISCLAKHIGVRVLLSKAGREYKKTVYGLWLEQGRPQFGKARLRVVVQCFPRDLRVRDLGNLDKALFDSLENAGCYDNDGQIDDQRFIRHKPEKPTAPGYLIVSIEELL